MIVFAGSVRGSGLQRAGRGTEALPEGQAPPPSARALPMTASKQHLSPSVAHQTLAATNLNPSHLNLSSHLAGIDRAALLQLFLDAVSRVETVSANFSASVFLHVL